MVTARAFTSFHYEVNAGVAHIRLDRADKRNCLVREFWYELPWALLAAESDPDARCVFLYAEGPMFTAGIDISILEMLGNLGAGLEASRKADYLRRTVLSLQSTLTAIDECALPVVMAIQGMCIGGGLDMASAADIRLVETGTQFIPLEMDLGFVPDLGTVQRLGASLPPAVVADWLLSCRSVNGAEALDMGFASRMADNPAALQRLANEVVSNIAAKSPLAVRGVKEILRFTRAHGVAASLRYTAAWQSGVFPGRDLSESLTARAEGRNAIFEPMADDLELLGKDDQTAAHSQ